MKQVAIEIGRKVVVWARGGYNHLGILRSLAPFCPDIENIVSAPSTKEVVRYSRYCRNCHFFENHDNALQYLIDNYKDNTKRPILYFTSDEIAEIVDLNREYLSKIFIISGTKQPGLLSSIQNKNKMAKIASECGFNVPASCSITRDKDLPSIPYPCFLRPALNYNNSFRKAIRVNTSKELLSIQNDLTEGDELVVSEYIPKEKDLLVIGVRFKDGNIYIPGCFIKDRWNNGESGTGSHGVITPSIPPSVSIEAIRTFLYKIDYIGPFSFEFGILNHVAFFYEVNLRNDGTCDYFNQCGANTVLAWVADCCDMDVSSITIPVLREGFMINEVEDYKNIGGRLTRSEWKKQRKEASVFVYYNKHDILPYLVMKWKQLNFKRQPIRVFNKIKKILKIK